MRDLLNFLYLFFLSSIDTAAGPLVIATRALVEVFSFWADAADMVVIGVGWSSGCEEVAGG
jgi:hypothetical protein